MSKLNPLRIVSLAVRFVILLVIVGYLEGNRDNNEAGLAGRSHQ